MLNFLRHLLGSSEAAQVKLSAPDYRRDEPRTSGFSPHLTVTGEPDGPRVLIVDDEPNPRSAFRTALATEGYAIAEAADADTAFELLRTWHPSVVVLDLRMPGVGGMEWLARARAMGSDVPAVIASGHVTLAAVEFTSQLGACDFLAKPTTPAALRQAVADAIRHDRKDASAQPTNRDPAQVEQSLRKSLELEPGNPTLLNLLGMLLESENRPNAAYHAYKSAVEADPGHAPALANLKRSCDRFGIDPNNPDVNPGIKLFQQSGHAHS